MCDYWSVSVYNVTEQPRLIIIIIRDFFSFIALLLCRFGRILWYKRFPRMQFELPARVTDDSLVSERLLVARPENITDLMWMMLHLVTDNWRLLTVQIYLSVKTLRYFVSVSLDFQLYAHVSSLTGCAVLFLSSWIERTSSQMIREHCLPAWLGFHMTRKGDLVNHRGWPFTVDCATELIMLVVCMSLTSIIDDNAVFMDLQDFSVLGMHCPFADYLLQTKWTRMWLLITSAEVMPVAV